MTKYFCDNCGGEILNGRSCFSIMVGDGTRSKLAICDNNDLSYRLEVPYMNKDFCSKECLVLYFTSCVLGKEKEFEITTYYPQHFSSETEKS